MKNLDRTFFDKYPEFADFADRWLNLDDPEGPDAEMMSIMLDDAEDEGISKLPSLDEAIAAYAKD